MPGKSDGDEDEDWWPDYKKSDKADSEEATTRAETQSSKVSKLAYTKWAVFYVNTGSYEVCVLNNQWPTLNMNIGLLYIHIHTLK